MKLPPNLDFDLIRQLGLTYPNIVYVAYLTLHSFVNNYYHFST